MSPDKKMARFAKLDFEEFMGDIHGYDLKKVRVFKDKLRKLCADADLIYLAKKRWAGEEHTEEHEDSNTIVDRLIAIIVSEMINLEKSNRRLEESK